MTTLSAVRPLSTAIWVAVAIASGTCSGSSELDLPLLVMAGPDNFTSFEIRTPNGEALWRLEADSPAPIPFLVYAAVPEGFQQVLPTVGSPRPLRIGEDLVLESRIPNRVFVHRAFANTSTTVTVLTSEMRRIEPSGTERGNEPLGAAVSEDS